MKVVPHAFYQNPNIEKILVDGLSCILSKHVTSTDSQNERYVASHALVIVLSGALRIETPEGYVQVIEQERIVFLPKGLYFISDLIPIDGAFQALVFFFDESICNEFLATCQLPLTKSTSQIVSLEYGADLKFFTNGLLSLYKGRNLHQFTKAKLLEFLHLISLSEQGEQFVSKLEELKVREKKNIKLFMEEHFDKPLDVEDYAYLTCRSVSTFRRDFRSNFDISPKKWLVKKRLEKAAVLLAETTSSVTSIALQVGYEDTTHFIKSFKQMFSISPKQFQLKQRKKMLA